MHEFALTEDLLKLAREEAERAGLTSIDKVVVRVGSLSGVFTDSIEFAFGIMCKEHEITKNAQLVIEHVQGKAKCTSCENIFLLDGLFLYCEECKTPTLEIIEGREFMLVSLEGERETEDSGIASDEAGDTNG